MASKDYCMVISSGFFDGKTHFHAKYSKISHKNVNYDHIVEKKLQRVLFGAC